MKALMVDIYKLSRKLHTLERNIASMSSNRLRTYDHFVYPSWPSAAILDYIEPEIAPFDPPTPITLDKNQTWSGSVCTLCEIFAFKLRTVTLKLRFGVTQGHRKRKRHYSIQHIRICIRLP